MVNISMDGKQIEVPEGTTVLQAARIGGIHIPTLCDHPNLTPYGGCRMCLVEVDGYRTPQPSCTLPVSNNMVIRTDTDKIRDARKFILTMIFSERNHFCMYCQKSGGDCELQNCAYEQGMDHWPIPPNWAPYPVDASHPDFILDHNRCILCRRCVRACGELVGNFTLGVEERGYDSILIADFGIPVGQSSCVSCGACVQACPTGALIDRKSAYIGHEAEVKKTDSICLQCSVGCAITVSTRDNHLLRIDGDWDAELNAGLLCQQGRYAPVKEERERIVTPLVKKGGALKAATWDEALQAVAGKFAELKGKNGDGIAALASTQLSVETLAAFKDLFENKLGSQMVTSTEEGAYTAAASAVAQEIGKPFEGNLKALEDADCVLSVGIDLAKDHQVVGFFVKRNVPKGTHLLIVDAQTSAMAGIADCVLKPNKGTEVDLLMGIASALIESKQAKIADAKADFAYTPEKVSAKTGVPVELIRETAAILAGAAKPAIVYGSHLSEKDGQKTLKAILDLARLAGVLTNSSSAIISPKGQANSLAAAQLGLQKQFQVNGHKAVFAAIGEEEPSPSLLQKIEKAPFLVVQAAYISAATAKADVVLPMATWAETGGHYLNLDGQFQEAHASIEKPEDVKQPGEILEGIAAKANLKLNGDWKSQFSKTSPVNILFN